MGGAEGVEVGTIVGTAVGDTVGITLGTLLGITVGLTLGLPIVGWGVGSPYLDDKSTDTKIILEDAMDD